MTFSNKRAIGTSSLGLHASHSLDSKIRAAAHHGFTGIEIVYGDLEAYSKSEKLEMAAAADQIRQLCMQNGLQVLSVCPFENFEGHNSPLQERLTKATHWINIARILGATYLQVPAQFSADASSDEPTIVSELQQLADLCSATNLTISIAYEPMSWSKCHSTWQTTIHLTQLVDRPNFKICLDTFHIATKLWASPYSSSGKYPDADTRLTNDLRALVSGFPMDKLSYIQLSDAERLSPPFSTSHPWYVEGEAAEFSWSKHARPFPLETELGGYLPVVEMVRAWVVETRFEGWVSMETFDRRMRDEGVKTGECARRAERSWKKLEDALQGRGGRL
ncbi:hypothetical protein M3J09_001334 [Ascochyta lentis]